MKNRKTILSLVLSAVLFVSVLAPASYAETPAATDSAAAESVQLGRNRRADAEEPENAIGRDAAIAKALAETGVTAEQAGEITVHVSETAGGGTVYRVHFSVDGLRYSCEVDAVSGEVLCTDTRSASASDRGQNRRSDGRDQGGSGQSSGAPSGGSQGRNRPDGGRGGAQSQSRGAKRDGSCVTASTDAA